MTREKIDFELLKEKARDGDVKSQFIFARCYEEGLKVNRNSRWAKYWYEKAADNGHIEAQLRLGDYYRNGGDYRSAALWYRRAASQGNIMAMTNLGLAFLNGHGVRRSKKTAMNWLEKAAAKNEPEACFCLGQILLEGDGTNKDPVRAERYLSIAAKQGIREAQKLIQFKISK